MPFTEDRGIDFRIDTGINLAGVSSLLAKIVKPNATTTSWSCTVYDEANGIIRYITPTGSAILDGQVGTWQIQARVAFATGEVYHGAVGSFPVSEVLVPT